jgi:hypothetical protein
MAIALAMAVAVPATGCLTPQAPAAHPGELAPQFELRNYDGTTVRLDALLRDGRAVVLVFYRGHW